MVFKALFMWVLDVSSIEQPCTAMNLLSNPSIRSQGCYLRFVVGQEKTFLNQVKRVWTRRNLESM
uniref:Cellulose synthase n=1 Tax=Rhizophora mucronata TaxID=61149 RepID=A0A2P2JBH9_RHIMU